MEQYSVEQLEIIQQNRLHLKSRCGEDFAPEALAQALTNLCPSVDYADHLSYCKGLQAGIDQAQKLCEQLPYAPEERYAEQILNQMTESMSEAQCKGFYLQCFESFRMSDLHCGVEDAGRLDSSALATLSKEELQKVVLQQVHRLSVSLSAEGLAAISNTMPLTENLNLKAPTSPSELLLLTASIYAAGVNGELPQSFEQYPELLGASLAAELLLMKDMPDEDESSSDLAERIFDVIEGVMVVAAIVAGEILELTVPGVVFTALGCGLLGIVVGGFATLGVVLLSMCGIGLTCLAAEKIREKIKAGAKHTYLTLADTMLTNETEYDCPDALDDEGTVFAPAF